MKAHHLVVHRSLAPIGLAGERGLEGEFIGLLVAIGPESDQELLG